jgi:hypothetical protein
MIRAVSDFVRLAYTRKREAEIAAGVIPVHWLDDVMAGLAVFAAVALAASL